MECYSLQNPFIAPITIKQVPQQQDLNPSLSQLKKLDLQSIHSTRSHNDTCRTDSNRSLSVSFNDPRSLREKLKDIRNSTIQSNRHCRSISPFKQSFCGQVPDVLSPFQERVFGHPGDYTPPNRHINREIESNSFQQAVIAHQKGMNMGVKGNVPVKKRETDHSFTWQEEEEDSRREGSTIEDDSLKEDEIREKLLQLQEDIIKKQKLKGRSVQTNRQMDSSSFFNETIGNYSLGKPSISPASLTRILASVDSISNLDRIKTQPPVQDFKRKNRRESQSNAHTKDKSVDLSIDINENYARIVHLASNPPTHEESSRTMRSKSPSLPSQVSSSVLLGCTKLQLFFHQAKFRNLNIAFKPLKEKTVIIRETFKGGELSRRENSMYDAPFSFRTCVSFVSEKHSNIQLGAVKVKNIMNKNVQTAFFALKSLLSFHQLQYKASIASGAIVLTKLFRAHERSLLLQCIGLWKLRDALQIQRDSELAQKDMEIKQLSREKNEALCTLAEEQDKRLFNEHIQLNAIKTTGETRKPLQPKNQTSNKENTMATSIQSSYQHKTPEKVSLKEKPPLVKKSPNILDETRIANQLLYEQLKALYDKKCFEETNTKESKPLRVLNDNTSYQKPFILGQPNKNGTENKQEGMVLNIKTIKLSKDTSLVESDDRTLRSRDTTSKRSSVASSAYNSSELSSCSGHGGTRRDSNKFWGL